VAAFLAGSMNTPESSVISTEIDIQNPTPRTLRLSVAPIQRPKRSRAARVLVFHDISQLKAYENQRADFVANVTHELRTPLSSLCGYAETLLKGVDDPESSRRFLAIIERQSQRLSRLIDDLLVLSDLERGLSPLKLELLDPKRLIEEACEVMRPQAEKREVTLTVECEDGIPPLAADRDRLQQVLLNLLDNGLKYTPPGGKVVGGARISSNGNGGGGGVELIVKDTGEGIPASHIPRLTERFYRVDRARSRELGGTGLGLAIVKHIVQLHHGRLTIESRVREGTTVRVWLPCQSAHTETEVDSVIGV
jgi:two-component system phosphate regulon sensor histidine kinase PhoR